MKACVQAQLDHPAQTDTVPLEQLGQRLAVAGSELLEQADRFTRRVVHDIAHTLLLARHGGFGTREKQELAGDGIWLGKSPGILGPRLAQD
jgi:hypothetical protein